jgi:hypothetical protein
MIGVAISMQSSRLVISTGPTEAIDDVVATWPGASTPIKVSLKKSQTLSETTVVNLFRIYQLEKHMKKLLLMT